jgi:DNA-binding NtrC family response regulator
MITSEQSGRTVRVLVVDEAREITRLLTGFLQRRGFEVVSTSNAEEALGMVSEQRPDVVLLDVSSSRGDGLELLERLRGTDHSLPVIAMAKAADSDEAHASLRMGARDFVAKPLDLAYLETSLWAQLTDTRAHPL